MIERKCLSCGTWNQDQDRCMKCENPISQPEIDRVEDRLKRKIAAEKPKDAFQLFTVKLKNHKYAALRLVYKIGYSVAVIFGAIGAFFAWMVALANG